MNDLNKAKNQLIDGNFTCVICKNEVIYTSHLRGVKPLLSWYDENVDFKGFSAADKVIGKATAFLYVLFEVKAVYGGVISKAALKVLADNGIFVEYGTVVDYIINRTGDGICPFEKAVMDIENKDDAYYTISEKAKELKIK